jgi:hypothetical protein
MRGNARCQPEQMLKWKLSYKLQGLAALGKYFVQRKRKFYQFNILDLNGRETLEEKLFFLINCFAADKWLTHLQSNCRERHFLLSDKI